MLEDEQLLISYTVPEHVSWITPGLKKEIPRDVLVAHEEGHRKSGHPEGLVDYDIYWDSALTREKEAWEVAIADLILTNKWSADARKHAIHNLADYIFRTDVTRKDALRMAAHFIDETVLEIKSLS